MVVLPYPNPATSNQIPDHSIMDYFNKQAYLGQAFTWSTDAASITGTSEVNFLYIANPVGSGKGLFVDARRLACNDVTNATDIVYRFYIANTAVSGGTAETPINLRPASPTTSLATVLLKPTATKGTLVGTFVVGWQCPQETRQLLILDPGQNLLLTAQPSASSVGVAAFSWQEI